MSNDTVDRRRFSRVPFNTLARISGPGGQWKSRLIDVSLKGALLARPKTWTDQPGDHFSLELMLGGSEVIIRMETEVAHATVERIGFRSTHIDLESMAHLKRLMELNLGDAETVYRELSSLGEQEAL